MRKHPLRRVIINEGNFLQVNTKVEKNIYINNMQNIHAS